MSRNKNVWLPIVAVLSVAIFISWLVFFAGIDMLGWRKESDDVTLQVESASLKDVATRLKNEGVIKSKYLFITYEKLYRKAGKVKDNFGTGRFKLNKSMSYNAIIRNLTQPPLKTVTVDLLPGMTVRDIAKKLAKEKVCKEDDFFEVLNKGYFDYEFLKQIPENKLRFGKYEGYFCPDKYEFYVGESPKAVINKFFKNFESKRAEYSKEFENTKFNLDEAIILASIVEKEAGSGDETETVAAVFVNRLKKPAEYPLLNADPTREYVENYIKPYIDNKNQEMYDAYNTDKRNGLPVGPICNPSIRSIKAVLNPPETDYYYFFTENKKFYWSKTLPEHAAQLRKYQK
ncbi:aminodeoxychorismate lyase [Clostridia bacterium]|nr:aminodeoxychorismate lyase [Clostridia bacterium]